jgi:hypothetical protein
VGGTNVAEGDGTGDHAYNQHRKFRPQPETAPVKRPVRKRKPTILADIGATSGPEEIYMSEWIPANPPLRGSTKGLHDAEMANSFSSVRDRAKIIYTIPPPTEDEQQIPVEPPAQRRHFVDPKAIGGRPTRRTD